MSADSYRYERYNPTLVSWERLLPETDVIPVVSRKDMLTFGEQYPDKSIANLTIATTTFNGLARTLMHEDNRVHMWYYAGYNWKSDFFYELIW